MLLWFHQDIPIGLRSSSAFSLHLDFSKVSFRELSNPIPPNTSLLAIFFSYKKWMYPSRNPLFSYLHAARLLSVLARTVFCGTSSAICGTQKPMWTGVSRWVLPRKSRCMISCSNISTRRSASPLITSHTMREAWDRPERKQAVCHLLKRYLKPAYPLE